MKASTLRKQNQTYGAIALKYYPNPPIKSSFSVNMETVSS